MDAQIHGRVLFVVVLSLCCFIDTNSLSSRTIIVSKRGSLVSSCGSEATPCKTMDLGIQRALSGGRTDDITILLKEGSYTLGKNYSFTSVNRFALTGEGHVEIACSPNVGIAFIFSNYIRLMNLKIHRCGGWRKSLIGYEKSTGETQQMKYLTALYFSYCKNIQFQNIEVSQSNGVGVTLTDISGFINITDSVFKRNVPKLEAFTVNDGTHKTDERVEGHAGGGLFVMLNSYEYSQINITREEHDKFEHDGKFFLRNVQFIGNEARSPDFEGKINSPLTPFSRGGGLGVYLFGNASGNTFTLSRCTFTGNRAQWGGGIQAEFKHVTKNNRIEIEGSTFSENYASFAGGGARIGDITSAKTAIAPNRVILKDCNFKNNTSIWGGGISIYGTTFIEDSLSSPDAREKFVLNNCVFHGNTGNVGSALGVFLFNLNPDNIGPLVPIYVVLENNTISNNYVVTIQEDVLIGQGALYTVEVPIISKGYLRISNNTHTSMVLDSAILVIHGNVNFSFNEGYRGGALALYGNSKVRFTKKSRLLFLENKCIEKGGALYVDAPGSPQVSFNATGYPTHQCFFQYTEKVDFDLWDTEIIFQGNTGPNEELGLSVYVTSLQNCRRVDETRKNSSALRWKIIKYLDRDGLNHSNIDKQVSTDPVDVVYRENDWYVAPSEMFNASITLLDEIGNPVYGIVNINVRSKAETKSQARLSTSSSLFLVNEKQVPFLTLSGRGGDQFEIDIRSEGRYFLEESIKNLTLRDCNPGFHREDDKCVCSDRKLRGVSRCDRDGRKVFLKRGFWAGKIKTNSSFYTVPCPVKYCQCPNPYNENTVDECTYRKHEMCAGNRDDSSVLCGKCKPGFTASFGSESCIPNCSKARIAYFLLIAFALTVLVMVLMTISVDAFTGYLNAWLYSYQVMSLIVPGTFEFDSFMDFIIGVANLQLRTGETGTCFTEGLGEASKLAVMYILPGFLLFIVFVIAKLVKRFPNWRYSQYVRAPFSAFSTIFVLCYTNITGISLTILNPVKIDSGDVRMFGQGDLQYFRGLHAWYGSLAIICIVGIVLPIPILLIFQPWIAKCLRRCNINMQSLKPLFDKLQGCFKDKYRWCAAYYFLSRLLILGFRTFVPQGSLKRVLLEAACVAILVIFVWLRPYKEGSNEVDHSGQSTDYSWFNNSDAVLLTNLTLISIFSTAIDRSKDHREGLTTFVKILAYVPLVVLVVVLYRSYKKYSKNVRNGQTKCEFNFAKRQKQCGESKSDPETSTSSDQDSQYTTTHNRQSTTDL